MLRDGEELELSGGITFGAAKEFSRFVDAMGAVKVVHLNSPGGRILEAQRIGDLIARRRLSTYVSARCLSACTVIFLNGVERLISPTARLGFHQPDFPGLTTEQRRDIVLKEEQRLVSLGVSREFARKANQAEPKDMWFPTIAELITAGVVTRVVNPSDLAISGIDQSEFATERLQKTLLNIKIYAAIYHADPDAYAKILESFQTGLRKGVTMTDLRAQVAPLVSKVLYEILPHASDSDLIMFTKFVVKETDLLNRESPFDCYFSLNSQQSKRPHNLRYPG